MSTAGSTLRKDSVFGNLMQWGLLNWVHFPRMIYRWRFPRFFMYDLSLGKGFPCDQYSAIWNTSCPMTSIFQYLLDENSTWLTWRDLSFKVILSCCPIIILPWSSWWRTCCDCLELTSYSRVSDNWIPGSYSWKKGWRTLSKKVIYLWFPREGMFYNPKTNMSSKQELFQ